MIETETGARLWVEETFNVPRETMERLDAFAALLTGENERQNLIARGTIPILWLRHMADSAQLLLHAADAPGPWIDLGSGPGFPGLIIAALSERPVTLVESRKLRVDFLHRAVDILGVAERVTIEGSPVERLTKANPASFAAISARAFAPLDKLLTLALPFSTEKTRWILPKGRSAASELEAARTTWQGEFRLEPSLTDPEAGIIVAEGVRPLRQRKAS